MSALVFDVESYPIDGAADYIEPATAPPNYKDPAKIADYIAQANAEQLAKAALDVDLARIVAIGVDAGSGAFVDIAQSEGDERHILTMFWNRVASLDKPSVLVGFNCIGFDLPLLLRRSLYLGVKAPKLQIGKYRHDGIEDLMLSLSFDGALRYRSLGFYTRRFNLDVAVDPTSGSDIGGLVAAGDWESVANHCRCDVNATVALAKRMGIL